MIMFLNFILWKSILYLFTHFVDGFQETLHIVGVEPVQVVDIALLVYQFVGRIATDADIVLNSSLLVLWQVVVDAVIASKIVLLDDILPRLFTTAVAEV
jgi:hypothetical protein